LINKNLAVGVFVALALIAFVTATIWLTGNRASEPTVYYSMYFEKDVGGLMLGGPVFYLGVEVGTTRRSCNPPRSIVEHMPAWHYRGLPGLRL
jgi:ABC-type transporter Mla subunit MlaD